MTNWKADPKVHEAREVCFTTDYENHPTRYLDAVCDAVWRAAVAASGSPPSPIEGENDCSTGCGKLADVSTEYHEEMCHGCYIDMLELIIERKDRELAERAEACAKVCEGRVTGFKSDLHEAYDNGARDCAEHIRAKFCDELRASSGSTGAPLDQPTPEFGTIVRETASPDSPIQYVRLGDDLPSDSEWPPASRTRVRLVGAASRVPTTEKHT